ncbi:MAG: hypothetical protein QM811_19375 [Pirellulales bacterium]
MKIPVQAVGGLTIEQAIRTPEYGAPLVVFGGPADDRRLCLPPRRRRRRRDAPRNLRACACLSLVFSIQDSVFSL